LGRAPGVPGRVVTTAVAPSEGPPRRHDQLVKRQLFYQLTATRQHFRAEERGCVFRNVAGTARTVGSTIAPTPGLYGYEGVAWRHSVITLPVR
jgi:hypothetical protein